MDTKTLYQQLQKDAEAIAQKAAALLTSYEYTFETVVQKDEGDLATSADIASEQLIIREIRSRYPDHSILSEEAGMLAGTAPFTWIIDPLDGTKEYARHAPEYNCLIAIEHHDALVVGIIQRNGINELHSCSKGNGAFLNGKPVRVSTINDLEHAFVSMYIPNRKFPPERIRRDLTILEVLIRHSYRVRGNNDESKAFSWVARGIYDGTIFVPGGGQWYDIAPGILFAQEAGATVTDQDGKPIQNRNADQIIVASNGRIHHALLECIQKGGSYGRHQ